VVELEVEEVRRAGLPPGFLRPREVGSSSDEDDLDLDLDLPNLNFFMVNSCVSLFEDFDVG